ncbi:MAG: hypothetical protein HN899_13115, partial [Gemmatimonadales bacterium]|nr:hypothetical protein [Gemmatimonadales bacterium]
MHFRHSQRAAMTVFALSAAVLAADASAQTLGSLPSTPWWEELRDETLTELLQTAMAENGDLDAAVARMLQADAAADRARSILLPSVSLDGQATTGPLDGLGFQFGGIPRGEGGSPTLPSLYYTGSANARARYRLSSWG